MSKTGVNTDRIEPQRESRLEHDDLFHCKECGISLPWQVVIIGEFHRCRECEKEALLEEFRREFPVEWAGLNPTDVSEKERKEDGSL